MRPGDLVFLDQFIDWTKLRTLTLFLRTRSSTRRCPSPSTPDLREKLSALAEALGYAYHDKGTMITIEGPRFSTKAESRMFRLLGADLINMSTVPEVSLASELHIPYQSVAMVTDYDCWMENEEPVSYEMVMSRMRENAEKVKTLLIKWRNKVF